MVKSGENQYNPDFVTHPGLTISELLRERSLTQADFAAKAGLTEKHVVSLVQGKVKITEETALRLQRVFLLPVEFWMRRQAAYDAYRSRLKAEQDQLKSIEWAKGFPYKKISDHGWVPATQNWQERAENLFRFFGIGGPNAISQTSPVPVAQLRTSARQLLSSQNLDVWLRRGEILGRQARCAAYDKSAFVEALKTIRKSTREPIKEALPAAKSALAGCGVVLVIVEPLPKTPYGATRWLSSDKALMQLSVRGKTDDHFWFSFFHEAAHILFHRKKQVYIEAGNVVICDHVKEEEEASNWAGDFLIPPDELEAFLMRTPRLTTEPIKRFAKAIGIAPGIVVGRLQHDNVIRKDWLNGLKRKIHLRFDSD